MFKFLGFCFCVLVYFSLINAYNGIIQRKVDLLKVDINTLLTKITKKSDHLETYNRYASCWHSLSNAGSYMDTKHLTNSLDQLKTEAEIELMFYRRLISKMSEIFPDEILLLKQRGPEVPYTADEMKLALTDISVSFSDFQGAEFSHSVPMNCPNDVPDEREWSLTSRVQMCPPYSCSLDAITVLPNGNIVTMLEKTVQIFAMNGTFLKSFESGLPNTYMEGITYWKENKILAIHVNDDNDGDIFAIDVELETTDFYGQAYPYEYSYGIAVFDDVIFTCSGNGILFVMHRPYSVKRGRMYQYEPGYYEKMFLYKSGPGSKYGLLKGRFFRHQYVLIKSTGEKVCSPKVDQYPTFIAKAAVGQNFFVVGTYHFQGFQAYDLNCNPLGEPVRFNPNYSIVDMDIVNNTLIVRGSDKDYRKTLFIYNFQ